MRSGDLAQPFGSNGGAVEIDETYIGFKRDAKTHRGTAHKHGVVALVDRESGQSRWEIDSSTAAQIHPIVLGNIAREARLMTDEAKMDRKIGRQFAEHGTTTHSRMEYVSPADRTIHTNMAPLTSRPNELSWSS